MFKLASCCLFLVVYLHLPILSHSGKCQGYLNKNNGKYHYFACCNTECGGMTWLSVGTGDDTSKPSYCKEQSTGYKTTHEDLQDSTVKYGEELGTESCETQEFCERRCNFGKYERFCGNWLICFLGCSFTFKTLPHPKSPLSNTNKQLPSNTNKQLPSNTNKQLPSNTNTSCDEGNCDEAPCPPRCNNATCENGTCEEPGTGDPCPASCINATTAQPPVTFPSCGDMICNGDESNETCPLDCCYRTNSTACPQITSKCQLPRPCCLEPTCCSGGLEEAEEGEGYAYPLQPTFLLITLATPITAVLLAFP